jgi:hypothetical protein
VTIAALAIVGALSFDMSPHGTALAAFVVPPGPQSFPGDAGFEETKSGCCSCHGGVCGCDNGTGHQFCCDGQDSPSCGC